MSNKERIRSTAKEMADVFQQHCIKVGVQVGDDPVEGVAQAYCNDDGLLKLTEIFDQVPRELRAAVYESFTMELTEQGICYSVDQFKGTVH